MKRPNLFEIATEELAQDTFLTWLLRWAAPEYAESDRELHECGVAFVKLLLGKEGDAGFRVEKIEAQREKKHIDVRADVNDQYTIIIEDKMNANEHSGQLERYRKEVGEECAKLGRQLVCVFIKTGFVSRQALRNIVKKGYRVVDRKMLLGFLCQHPAGNLIYKDFVGHWEAMEETEGMWNTQPVKDWCCKDEAWCGFYQFLDEVKDEAERLGWGYVSNPAGGFWGCWWHFLSRKECELYWQIEKEGKLCLKIGSVNENREQVRGKWLDVVMKHKEECHLTELQRAPHLRLGRSMTLAIVPRQAWLGADDSLVDEVAVMERLGRYEAFLNECVAKAECE